jgi:enoyl-CoA hydratase/carnithine racemase
VQVGLVAADGGPLVWPMQMSILQAKEYALTGARIPAAKAVELGLANHVVADPLSEAIAAAKKILDLPQKAVESTKRILNIQLERQVMMTLDYATTAEELTFATDDLKNNIARLLESN